MGETTYLHSPGFSQKPCSSSQPGRQMAVEGRKEENIFKSGELYHRPTAECRNRSLFFFPLNSSPSAAWKNFSAQHRAETKGECVNVCVCVQHTQTHIPPQTTPPPSPFFLLRCGSTLFYSFCARAHTRTPLNVSDWGR